MADFKSPTNHDPHGLLNGRPLREVPKEKSTEEQIAAELRGRLTTLLQGMCEVMNDASAAGMFLNFTLGKVGDKTGIQQIIVAKIFQP